MATLDERVEVLEKDVNAMKSTLDRHSNKLTELFGLKETISEVKTDMKKLNATVSDLKRHQDKTDKQLLRYSKITVVLLGIILGLFLWIGAKSPSTAKDLAEIVVKTGVQGL